MGNLWDEVGHAQPLCSRQNFLHAALCLYLIIVKRVPEKQSGT